MSYYNYTFYPEKVSPEVLRDRQYEEDVLVFTEEDKGFGKLKFFVGEDLLSKTYSGLDAIFLIQTKYASDAIRPRELNWSLKGKVWYRDANCFIPVVELEHHINWSSVGHVEDFEYNLKRYTDGIRKYGNKLIVVPQ